MKNLLNVKPLETYTPPNVPTLEESRKNPDFLKKLPLRWRKHAALLTAAGLMGAWAFSGCAERTPEGYSENGENEENGENYNNENNNQNENEIPVIDYTTDPPTVVITADPTNTLPPEIENPPEITTPPPETITTSTTTTTAITSTPPEIITTPPTIPIEADDDLLFRMHTGGSGSVYYVVYFTEQEALGMIRAQLEAEGLNLGCEVPDYSVEIEKMDDFRMMPYTIGADLSLYDSIRNVAVSLSNWQHTREIADEFAKQNGDIAFGVFHVPNTSSHISAWDYDWYEDEDGNWLREEPSGEIMAADKARARPILEENINNQIAQFIALLRAEGII